MAGDAPKDPGTPDTPKQVGPRKVTSLTEIVEAARKSPPKPARIMLEWILPPSQEEPQGLLMQMDIETRYPDDPWLFGIKYMTEVMDTKRSKEPNDKGELVQMHPDADIVAVAREVIVSPTWLHNEPALAKLKASIPATTFSELRRRLMLVAGLNADFFADYQEMTVPRAWLQQGFESPNGSDSPPGASTTSPPVISSPGSSTIGSADKKPVESALETNSGSSPSIPTTEPPEAPLRPIRSSETRSRPRKPSG